ncbi:MAG: radical SAM protein [Nanoarchaeota archaeon]
MVKETKRVKLHTNHACNLKCVFCYYGDSSCIKEKEPTMEELKRQLRMAKENGALDVDFSGGESTIMPNFPELVAYAKKLGFRTICLITNGLRISKEDYLKKLIDMGLNDVLFSIEGHNAETHEKLTRIPGSFNKITKAIKNVKKNKLRCRINITVTKENYKDLEKFARFLLQFEPDAVNFIKFNPWDISKEQAKILSPKYSDLEPLLRKSIDILSPKIVKITVRYIPYCFMKEYEKHVCNYMHLKNDVDEWWLPSIQEKMGEKNIKNYTTKIKKLIKNIPIIFKLEFKDFLSFNKFVEAVAIKKLYVKPKQCERCKYFLVCDGIDRPYPEIYGNKEIVPVIGDKIKNPMFVRSKYLEEYERKNNF